MNKYLSIAFLFFFGLTAIGQNDSIRKIVSTRIETYDVVAQYKERKDSRGETIQYTELLKGEIINYDATTGLLTFKDTQGRMYSLRSQDYKYFEYDQEFKVKNKQKVTLVRDEFGWDWSIGLSMGYTMIQHNFEPDNYFLNGIEGDGDLPLCLRVGAGKHVNANSTVGVSGDLALLMGDGRYFGVGARYQYLYTPTKNNAFYFPLELRLSQYQFGTSYDINDTTFTDGGWTFPTSMASRITTTNLELNVGQGISFALPHKRSFSLELMFQKQFTLHQEIELKNSANIPDSKYAISGLRLAAFMNF